MVSVDLLEVLACPRCKDAVECKGDAVQCRNDLCGLAYPIRDGVPVMLVSEATGARTGSTAEETP